MNGIKIATVTAVYNNRKFLEPVLESIKDFSDQIIIVEGAWNPELPNRSQDGTIEYLKTLKIPAITLYYNHQENLPLPNTETYRPIVLANELKARQLGLDLIDPDTDWLMWVDSDEVYNPEDLQKLREYLEDFTGIDDVAFSFSIPSFVFYFNFDFGTKEYFNRIMSIKEKPKLGYTDRLSYDIPVTKEIIPNDICFLYHYGYLFDDRVKTKMSMWDKNEADYWYEKVYLPMTRGEKININNFHLFARKLNYGQKFEKFKGQHPKIIQNLIKNEIKNYSNI